mgnify:CR=1 FL=1
MKFLIATLTVFLLLSSKTLAQDTEPTIPTFVQVEKPIICASEEQMMEIVKLHEEVLVSAWIDANVQFPVFLYANWEKGTTTVLEMAKPGWLCSLSTGTGAAFIENKPQKGIDFKPVTWYK